MQKIYIILLLSISSCLSKPQVETKDVPQPPKPLTNQATAEATKAEVAVSPTSTTTVAPPILESTKPTENVTHNGNVTKAEISSTPQTASNNSSAKDANNNTSDKKEEVPAKTDVKNKESQNVTVIPAANEQSPKTEAPPAHKTKPKVNPTTPKTDVTSKPNATITSTVAPKADGEKPTLQARGFDGPSFIGGIILTLGLLAIGFMGFKYYKNQTERNYHTL